jgi:hypothetical protein
MDDTPLTAADGGHRRPRCCGASAAQQQLSHAKLATTEAHYLQRQTRGPDVRAVPDTYAGGYMETESIQESVRYGRVAKR